MPSARDLELARSRERWYPLKYHPVQDALVNDDARFKIAVAGRRCLAAGTLVATPNGPIPIENLSVGDAVIGFESDRPLVTHITDVYHNGRQTTVDLVSSNRVYLSATEDHRVWACNESFFDKRRQPSGSYCRLAISDLSKRTRVRRCYVGDLIVGGKNAVAHTYILGALIGNGCSRDNKSTNGSHQKTLRISEETDIVPRSIAEQLGCTFRRSHENNYTWAINVGPNAIDAVPFYRQWCSGRYSHQKIAIWDEIDTWDRHSCLAFLAGLIDTDGSVYFKTPLKRELIVQFGMQSRSVAYCYQRLVLKYFQEDLRISKDDRPKYKNGPVYSVKTSSNSLSLRMLGALRPYLKKRGDVDVSSVAQRNVRDDRIGLRIGHSHIEETFDITVACQSNLYVLHKGGIVTSNSGKTERAKRYLIREAMTCPWNGQFFAAAPTHPQVRDIFWEDLKLLSFLPGDAISETRLELTFPHNLAVIKLISLDEPARMQGPARAGGIIDEIAECDEDVWKHVLPALDTKDAQRPDYRAWCWFIGRPDGINHYYRRIEMAKLDPNWRVYKWPSADILDADVIEQAKRNLSPREYREQYEASFETVGGRIYGDYGDANATAEALAPHEQILWAHDFNFSPLSSAICVKRGDTLFIVGEIVLESAVARQSALEFTDRFAAHGNRSVVIYGDPAGRAGEKHGHQSDYTEIEQLLRQCGWSVHRKVKKSAPAIRDRQNAVRAMIKNAAGDVRLFVNPRLAPYVHEGLSTCQLKEGSSFLEADSNYQHITTAVGYLVDYEWPVRPDKKEVSPIIRPTVHRWSGVSPMMNRWR